MVTPKCFQWSDSSTMVGSTVTVSMSLRRLSFSREKVMISNIPPFKFNLFRHKYASNLISRLIFLQKQSRFVYHCKKQPIVSKLS